MILNRLVQEADALTILNETSGVKNVSPTKLTKIRLYSEQKRKKDEEKKEAPRKI